MPEQDHNERKCILENSTGNILVTKAGFLTRRVLIMDLNTPLEDLRRPHVYLKRPLIDLERSHMDLKTDNGSKEVSYAPQQASY